MVADLGANWENEGASKRVYLPRKGSEAIERVRRTLKQSKQARLTGRNVGLYQVVVRDKISSNDRRTSDALHIEGSGVVKVHTTRYHAPGQERAQESVVGKWEDIVVENGLVKMGTIVRDTCMKWPGGDIVQNEIGWSQRKTVRSKPEAKFRKG